MKTQFDQATIKGITYHLVPVPIKPKSTPEWKPRVGELCEFYDNSSDTPHIDYFLRMRGYGFESNFDYWHCCRPIQDPNLMQMIPWEGGECPVPGATKMLILDRDGDMTSVTARSMRWSHIGSGGDIVKYAVLK